MGTWGHGPFESDSAAEFLDEAEESPARAVSRILTAIRKAPPGAYLDVDDGAPAWAACELVALAFGRGDTPTLSGNVMALVARLKPQEKHRMVALAVLDRIADPTTSELAGLWHEGSDGPRFDAALSDLRARLEAASAGAVALAKPRVIKAGEVFALPVTASSWEVVVVQVVGPSEVAVFEGTCVDDAAALACVKTRPARRVCTVLKKLERCGRSLGSAAVRKDLKGKKLYGDESGDLAWYIASTANHRELSVGGYEQVRGLDRLQLLDADGLRGIALGTFVPEPIKSPDERVAEMYREHGTRWAARRAVSTPGPFGDVDAVEKMVAWMEEYGVDNALYRNRDLAAGRQGYGRPSEESERRSYAFAALVALWRGTWPRDDWPPRLAGRLPAAPEPAALAEAVETARHLAAEVITFDAELRLIWDAAADGGAALREQVRSLQASLSK